MEEIYSSIRELLGEYCGRTIADITQHDCDEWEETHQSYVMVQFTDGSWLKFPIGDDGFSSGEG